MAASRALRGRLVGRGRRRPAAGDIDVERALAEHAAVLGMAVDAVLRLDQSGVVVDANLAASVTFGYERTALVGRPAATLLRSPVLAMASQLERPVRVDAVAERDDGTTVPVELTIVPVAVNEARRTAVLVVRDITDRQRVERQLQESKRAAEEEAEIASALLYAAETLSAHLDQPYMLDRVTCRAVEAVGCDWGATLVWDDRHAGFQLGGSFGLPSEMHGEAVELARSREVANAGRGSWPGALVEIADPAAQRVLPAAVLARWGIGSLVCVPICRGDEVAGLLCLGHRVARPAFSSRQRRVAIGIARATATALENARLIADLQAANRLKNEFVSTMSHELRTPLHVILGFAEMARDADLDVRQRTECLARVDQAGRDLLAMIESTLEIGRLDTGRDELETADVSLPALLDELRDLCGAMPREPGVTLVWCEGVPRARLVTDQRKLSIVLRNLIGNALKFTRQGHVRLAVRVWPLHVDFVVSDTGIGIRPEDRATIFEMFRQADQSDSRRFGGTGLGLYIVRRYVEQLGGTIELASEVGAGSTFTVSVPRGAVPAAGERAA